LNDYVVQGFLILDDLKNELVLVQFWVTRRRSRKILMPHTSQYFLTVITSKQTKGVQKTSTYLYSFVARA